MDLEKARRLLLRNRDLVFEVLRIYLGLALLVKGFYFLEHTTVIVELLGASKVSSVSVFIAHYVVSAHLIGGGLLALGLATRFSALIQLPAVLGAIFFVYLPEGLFTGEQSLEFVILVSLLLCAYALYGSGRISVDHYLRTHPSEDRPSSHQRPKKAIVHHF